MVDPSRFGLRSRIALAVGATALAATAGWFGWSRWYYGDADSFEESVSDHIASYDAMRPGGTFRVASFPARERMDEVPTYTVTVNQRFLREREFEDTPVPGVRRVFAVGDSATFGTGVAADERFTAVLQEGLDAVDPGCCEVLNAGWVGSTTEQVLLRVRRDVLLWSPTVLIVNGGVNDLRVPGHPMALDTSPGVIATFEDHVRRIIEAGREEGVEVVLWANANADRRLTNLVPQRDALRRIATAEGVPLVDFAAVVDAHPATAEEQRWFLDHDPWTAFNGIALGPDGIPTERAALQVDWLHPNQFGHRRLGEALLPHVREALDRASRPPTAPRTPRRSSPTPPTPR